MGLYQTRGGTALVVTSPPWSNLATIEQIVTNTNALTADATVTPTETKPTQTADTNGLISTSGARFMVRTNGAPTLLLKFALGHASAVDGKWAQALVRGWKEHKPRTGKDYAGNLGNDRNPQYQRDFLCRMKLLAGATSAHPGGGVYSLLCRNAPASNNQAAATLLNWVDAITIAAGADKTSGGVIVLSDIADGSAVAAINAAGYSDIEVELSCTVPSDETGNAASCATGCWTEA